MMGRCASPLCALAAALIAAVVAATSSSLAEATATPPLPVLPVPTAAQLRWQRREVIMFFHFGMNTFTDSEWGTGREPPAAFRPAALDASQWMDAAAAAGASLVVLVAKHHDGFCLWPSAHTAHSVRASPWRGGRGDVVREFADAARARGLDIGIYLSPWDRHDKRYGREVAYNEYYLAQLHELLTGSVTRLTHSHTSPPPPPLLTSIELDVFGCQVRERVGDMVRRRQGEERDEHDVPFPGVVPDGAAAAELHQHLLRRRPRPPVGRRREWLRRIHLLVHHQPLQDHHRRGRHREVGNTTLNTR